MGENLKFGRGRFSQREVFAGSMGGSIFRERHNLQPGRNLWKFIPLIEYPLVVSSTSDISIWEEAGAEF